jgi:hypothetical protein
MPLVALDVLAGGAAPTSGAFSWTHAPKSCPPSNCVLVVEVAVLGGAINKVNCGTTGLLRVSETNWGTFSTSVWLLSPFAGSCTITVEHGTSFGGQGHTSTTSITRGMTLPGAALIQVTAAPVAVSLQPNVTTTSMWSRATTNYSAAAGYSLADNTGAMNVGWGTSGAPAAWTEAWLLLPPAP